METSPSRQRTILVVEDNAKLADLLSRAFREEGWVVTHVADGDQALERAASGVFDLVVLDWMLPGRDGLSVCHELREQGFAAPILMLTARRDVPDRIAGLDAGADDYLAKPFELEEL